jgi:hypothetical protein
MIGSGERTGVAHPGDYDTVTCLYQPVQVSDKNGTANIPAHSRS